jgi:hypothetical protein
MSDDNLKQPNQPATAGEDSTQEPTRPQREPGNAPEGEPGNAWVTPEAERPPRRREGTVSDPDQYPSEPPAAHAESLPNAAVGIVSNPDF